MFLMSIAKVLVLCLSSYQYSEQFLLIQEEDEELLLVTSMLSCRAWVVLFHSAAFGPLFPSRASFSVLV